MAGIDFIAVRVFYMVESHPVKPAREFLLRTAVKALRDVEGLRDKRFGWAWRRPSANAKGPW
jgi:hypothetical protein